MGGENTALVCTADDGLINPAGFPCKSADLDVEVINGAADNVAAIGTNVLAAAEDASTAWAGLKGPGVFETPDRDAVHALMDPAVEGATLMDGVTSRISTAIETYATALAGIKPDLEDLEVRAAEFRARALEGYEVSSWEADGFFGTLVSPGDWDETKEIGWREHGPAVEENQGYVDEYNAIIERISTAASTCATAIQAELTMVCVAPPTVITAEALANTPEISTWGSGVDEDRNCTESVGHGFANFGTGLWDGVQSLGGFDPETGDHSWGLMGRSWLGVGDFLLSTVIITNPALAVVATQDDGPVGNFLEDRFNTAYTGWGSLVGWDHQAWMAGEDGWHKWKEDGVATGTETIANIGTFFIPVAGWAGGGAKVVLSGTKVGSFVVRVGTHVAEFAIPGGSHIVAGTVRIIDLSANGLKGGWRALVEGIGTAPMRPSPLPGVANAATDIPTLPPRTPVSESLGLDQPPSQPGTPGAHVMAPETPSVPESPVMGESPAGSRNPDLPDTAPGQHGADPAPAQMPDGGPTHDKHGRPFEVDADGRRHIEGDPDGTYRDTNGALHDEATNSFVHDPNKPETGGDVQMAERGETTHPVLDETAQAEHSARVQERAELQADSNAAHRRLTELANATGVDPGALRHSQATVEAHLEGLVDAGQLSERQARQLETAATQARDARSSLSVASRELAEQIADSLATTRDRTTMIDALDQVGRDRLDHAAIGVTAEGRVVFTVTELKGGNAGLGTRVVDGVEVQQGTTPYIRDLLSQDPRVADSLHEYLQRPDADPRIAEAIRRGEVQVEYNLVEAKPNGTINETDFVIDPITLPPLN
ncbi:hypothetical protein ACNPNP_19810 [Microbacterium sp. AGC85]